MKGRSETASATASTSTTCCYAEELGYHSVFVVEHHFTGVGQLSASLNFLSYLAGRTRRIRLGTAVVVLPWHNPVLLAEQVATLDLLSNGRLDFGVGKGYRPPEFAGFCIPIEEATERFDEAIAFLRKAWTAKGRFSHHGKRWHFDNIVIEPRPVQQPHPPLWMGAGSFESIRRAAREGFNLLLDQIAPVDLIIERVAAYREELDTLGRPLPTRTDRRRARAADRAHRGGAPERLCAADQGAEDDRRAGARTRRRALPEHRLACRSQPRQRGVGAAGHARGDHRAAEEARGRRRRLRAAGRPDGLEGRPAHLRRGDHAGVSRQLTHRIRHHERTYGQGSIVTGAGRGLGRGMALGLARLGATVIGPAHIISDFGNLKPADALPGCWPQCRPAAIRHCRCGHQRWRVPAACTSRQQCWPLTLTYVCPDLYRRAAPPKFWEASDEIVQNVMDANLVAADKLARRAAPIMVEQGWGRILKHVTTMLDTMSRVGFSPYGPSKAALEMASWVWAKELEGSGVTVNIVNPGAGANTPGMAEEIRRSSREGHIDRLVEPEDMVASLVWVVSREADAVNGMRYDAKRWDSSLPPPRRRAAAATGRLRAARAAGSPRGPILAALGAPMTQPMLPRERAPYSAIVDRPPLKLPGNARVIVWSIVNLEVWDICAPWPGRCSRRRPVRCCCPTCRTGPGTSTACASASGASSICTSGSASGPTLSINARVCEDYRARRRSRRATPAGSPWAMLTSRCRSTGRRPAGMIQRSMDTLEGFTGKRPVGWLGPGPDPDLETPELLAEAGVNYIGDWVYDDEPTESTPRTDRSSPCRTPSSSTTSR